jgi:hypothetical protein
MEFIVEEEVEEGSEVCGSCNDGASALESDPARAANSNHATINMTSNAYRRGK